jgi:hypothetical protein
MKTTANRTTLRTDRSFIASILEQAGAEFKGNSCRCIFHDDASPSAGLYQKDGVWRFKCQVCDVGGDYFDIKGKLDDRTFAEIVGEHDDDLPQKRPAPQAKMPANPPRVYADLDKVIAGMSGNLELTDKYSYTNPDTGKVELIILKLIDRDNDGKKTFRQFYPVDGGFVMKAPAKPWPLYNRSRIKKADSVVVCEGEKCCHIFNGIGIVATTSPCGGGKAQYADWEPLAGKTVYLWPDNDEKGMTHMGMVEESLNGLDNPPEVCRIDVSSLNLPPKGDVEQFIEGLGDVDNAARYRAVMDILKQSQPNKPSARIMQRNEEIIDGKWRSEPFPWDFLTKLSSALIPGTVTLIVGSPSSAKSFFAIQCMAYWYEHGVKSAILELEDDLEMHLKRAIAQHRGMSELLDDVWIKDNPEKLNEAHYGLDEFINGLGSCIHEGHRDTTLTNVRDWISNMANRGNRIVCVDPVTAAEKTSRDTWLEDARFMKEVRNIAKDTGISLILITHPVKGCHNDKPDLDYVSGGSAYIRNSHCVLWLQHHYPEKEVDIAASVGTLYGETINKSLLILKSRGGIGTGYRLGFNFDKDTLSFEEKGVIKPKTIAK